MSDRYHFQGGPNLDVDGDATVRRQFALEYAAAAVPAAAAPPRSKATVVATFAPGGSDGRNWVAGGHKTMKWTTALSAPDAGILEASIMVSGWPRAYGLSMVQGYFLEPLVSVAAARCGSVLLPAASFCVGGTAIVLLGLSGSGKTSLSMQALALGYPVFGDDQVFVLPDGSCHPFPRRARLYPDLRRRVPRAYGRLPAGARARLEARRAVRLITGGFLAPSLAVSPAVLGQAAQPPPAAIGRVVILERTSSTTDLRCEVATIGDAIDFGIRALKEQRAHLWAGGRDEWREGLADVERKEARLLGSAFACAQVTHIVVPTTSDRGGVARLGEMLGLEPPELPTEQRVWS
jgi:hypothetical protein